MTDYKTIKNAIKGAIPDATNDKCKKELINAMKTVLKSHYPKPTDDVPNPEPIKPKRGRPRKYFTEEERLEAIRRQKREYKQRQKAKKLAEMEAQQRLAKEEAMKKAQATDVGDDTDDVRKESN